MREPHNMNINTVEVFFGVGAFEEGLKFAATQLPGGRWFVVTSRGGSMERTGWIPRLREVVSEAGVEVEVCKCVETNPTVETADEAYRMAREFGATVVVGIGGGSSLDVAKAVAAGLASLAEPSKLYRGEARIKGSVPVVAIPSTHGTGSEVNRFAVLSDPVTRSKGALVSRRIRPKVAIDDPRLTETMPGWLSGATVVDALSHALESYVARAASMLSRGYSREALYAIRRGVEVLEREGWSREARRWFLYASMEAGVAIDHARTGVVHALEHPISFYHPNVHHGVGLAALLPCWVVEEARVSPELLEALRVLGVEASKPEEAGDAIRKLIARLMGEWKSVSSLGVGEDELDRIVEDAMRYMKPVVDNDPLGAEGADALMRVLRACYK